MWIISTLSLGFIFSIRCFAKNRNNQQSSVLRPLRAYLLTKSQYIETGAHPLH